MLGRPFRRGGEAVAQVLAAVQRNLPATFAPPPKKAKKGLAFVLPWGTMSLVIEKTRIRLESWEKTGVKLDVSLVARVPVYQPGRAEPGRLYRRGVLLYVHQGSLHVTGLDGPRGRLPALAYNYIVQRFASFFAVRRATLRALATLPAEVQRSAATSIDPCLRQQAEQLARAS